MAITQKLDLKKIAEEIKYVSPLMIDKDKIETSDICKYYGKGITVTAIEPMSSENGDAFFIYNFKEAPDKFAFSGFMLNKLFAGLIQQAEGDLEAVNEYLATGVCKLKLTDKKSKDGKKSYTDFEVIE